MRRLTTSRRLAGLIAVLVVAAGITAGSAQTENRRGDGRRSGLELTYTKWFQPSFPHMVGVVGGDIVGQFGGAVLNTPMPDAAGRIPLTAIYIVRATDASRSLTIRVEGAQQGHTAVLEGRVVDGWLKGARARAEFDVLIDGCTESPVEGPCFQGKISIRRGGDDEDDD